MKRSLISLLLVLVMVLAPITGMSQVTVRTSCTPPVTISYGTLVFSGTLTSNTTSDPLTTTASVSAGQLIVLFYFNGTGANPATSVTDSGCGGAGWTVDATADATGLPVSIAHAVCTNGLASGQTITVSHTGAFNFKTYAIMSANGATGGVDNGAPTTCSAVSTGGSPFPVTCSKTTTTANTIIFYGIIGQNNHIYTVNGSWTAVGSVTDGNGNMLKFGYRIVTSAAGYDIAGNFDNVETYSADVGAYK